MEYEIKENENRVIVNLTPQLYPPDVIYGAAYAFLDRAYLFLDGDPKNKIFVTLKGKNKLDEKQLEKMAGEFSNEIIHCALRTMISRNNKNIREAVVLRALTSADQPAVPKEESQRPQQKSQEWKPDTLGTALPWEEKYGK